MKPSWTAIQNIKRMNKQSHHVLLDAEGGAGKLVGSRADEANQDVCAGVKGRNPEDNLRMLFENAPIGIFQSSRDRLVHANPAVAKMFGYESAQEMLASCDDPRSFFVQPEQRQELVQQAMRSDGYTMREIEYWRKDGSIFVANVRMRAYRDACGKFQFLEGFVEDITERKKLESELALREQRLNSFFQNATAGLCILDPDLRYVQINEMLAKVNGYPVEQHIGRTLGEMLPELAPTLEPLLRRILATGESILNHEVSGETPGEPGVIRDWIVSYFPILGAGRRPAGIGSVVVEITDQKRAEQSLRESEEKFRQLTENIKTVFWMSNREMTQVIYVSPTYEQVWGRSCQSLYDKPLSFTEAIHPADRDRMLESLKRQKQEGKYEMEYRIIRPDGTTRWVHDRGFAVRNEQGEFYRMAGLAEDVTERRQLEEQFRQAQKMEAVGQLAGGVAHDFNNILAATLMHLGLLQHTTQLTAGAKESLNEVEAEIMRAANLSRQLLLFSRREQAAMAPLDLNALVNGMLKMLRRVLAENIELVFQSGDDFLFVEADAGMLEQVVMNLCVNARDAMPQGGTLKLDAKAVEFNEEATKTQPEARLGRFVCLTVRDSGCGMEASVLSRVFEPFFTTKEPGKGTGLGLATAYGIVKQHQGLVEVESTPGQGTVFRVYLPAGNRSPDTVLNWENPAALKGGSETILLVEDETALRRTAALCLRKLGYAVLEAGHGPEALQVWRQHHQKIDLLLTDMVMPKAMTGAELAECLSKEQENLKVIISSGYVPERLGPRLNTIQKTAYLPKPYKTKDLAQIVRRCLDKK